MGADFRRFCIGGYSNGFAARGDAARARGSPAVPRWGFFQFLCRARWRDADARVSGGFALAVIQTALPHETTRRGRAGLRRFRVGVSSSSFAARDDATRARGSPAVPHWGFFQFLCRARWRDADARGSSGFALAVSRNFAARSDANARVSGGFALAILPALLAHEARRFHVREVIPALSRTRRCGRGRG